MIYRVHREGVIMGRQGTAYIRYHGVARGITARGHATDQKKANAPVAMHGRSMSWSRMVFRRSITDDALIEG